MKHIDETPEIEKESQNNETLFDGMLEKAYPELYELKQAMNYSETDIPTIIKMLYSISNVKKFTKWGSVSILIQNGKEMRIESKQGFKLDSEE